MLVISIQVALGSNPLGVHKIITKISNIRWTPHGPHLEFMELCGICGVHLESMGECKVHQKWWMGGSHTRSSKHKQKLV